MVKIIDRQIDHLPILKWAAGKPTAIILHETANDNDNGSYEGKGTNEIGYMANNYENAFVHFFSAEKDVAMVHDPAKGGAWGAGPSMHYHGIHIELVRSNNKKGFKKAYKNWIQTAVMYAKKYDIPMVFNSGTSKNGFFTHNYVRQTWGGTSHTDPDAYLKKFGVSISQLKKDLEEAYGKKTSKPVVKPSKDKPKTKEEGSIVDYLKSQGIDSSVKNRKKLAKEYEVKGYDTSAEKNLELLNAMKKGKKKNPKPSKPKGIKVGDKVTLSKSSKKYATGEKIPKAIKGKKYTVQQVKKDRVLLKEIYSWAKISDVGGSTSTSKPKKKPSYKGKRVGSIYNGDLKYYNKPSWKSKDVVGYLQKGIGFPTIVSKVKVDGSYQYKVKNSKGKVFYVTASTKYVKVI